MKNRRLRLGKETLRALQPADLGRAVGATKGDFPTGGLPGGPFLSAKPCPLLFSVEMCPPGTSGICFVSFECPTRGLGCEFDPTATK